MCVALLGVLALFVCLHVEATASTIVSFDDFQGTGHVPNGYGGIIWGGGWTYYDYGDRYDIYKRHSGAQRIYADRLLDPSIPSSNNHPRVPVMRAQASAPLELHPTPVGSSQVRWSLRVHGSQGTVSTRCAINSTMVPTTYTTVVGNGPPVAPDFFACPYSGPVTRGEIEQGSIYWVLDDTQYSSGSSPVLEPASLALLGLACGEIGMMLKKRKKP
jgi:hypothetical protein